MSPSPERLKLLAKLLRERGIETSARAATIPPRESPGEAPLSHDQRRLWFLDRLDPGTSLYNDCITLHVAQAELDPPAFRAALEELVRRHETLRTSIVADRGEPVQHIAAAIELPFREVDLSGSEPDERDSALARLEREEATRPFPLDTAPLWRATLVRLDARDWALVLTMHHIVSDGVSYAVFAGELSRLHDAFAAGQTAPPPPERVSYGDFAAWQRARADAGPDAAKLAHWQEVFAREVPALELPYDGTRANAGQTGAMLFFRLPDELVPRLREVCRREGRTSNQLLLASWFALLASLGHTQDIVTCIPNSARDRVELEQVIGFFVRTIALRVDLSGDPTLEELVKRVAGSSTDACANGDVPFEEVARLVRVEQGLEREQAFRHWFAHMRDVVRPLTLGGGRGSYRFVDGGHARFDLSLIVDETETSVKAFFEYDAGLFQRETIERFARHWTETVRRLLHEPKTRLSLLREGLEASTRSEATGLKRARRDARLHDLQRVRRKSVQPGETT